MIDILNLSYNELMSLQTDIEKKMREMKEARYKELKEAVKQSVKALIAEGFGSDDAIEVYCEECDTSNMISWRSLLDYLNETYINF